MAHICDKCGDTLIMKVVHEGTPYEDFDGFICPTCEQREKEAREQYERDNADILKLIRDADEIRRRYKVVTHNPLWTDPEKITRFYANYYKKYI